MEGEEKTKEYNDQDNGETPEENTKKLISLENESTCSMASLLIERPIVRPIKFHILSSSFGILIIPIRTTNNPTTPP